MIQHFYRLLRLTAIPLAIAGFLTLLSGFTTTKYFIVPGIGYSLSYFIHTIIFPLVFMPLFFLHSLAGTLIVINRHKSINKKAVKVFMAGLWVFMFCLFVFLYAAQNAQSSSVNPGGINTSANGTGLSLSEIAGHGSTQDCWLIISNRVYDVTGFLSAHPGGTATITPYCGKDATNAFATKDKGVSHSPTAESMLNLYYIGDVGGTQQNLTIPSQPGPGSQNSSQTPPANLSGATLTLSEIAKHDVPQDCWLIINNKVYDVTNHLRVHPAGAASITPYCGKDGTAAYDTKGGAGGAHSYGATASLGPILLGNVGETISSQTIQQAGNQTSPSFGDGEGEWEDD